MSSNKINFKFNSTVIILLLSPMLIIFPLNIFETEEIDRMLLLMSSSYQFIGFSLIMFAGYRSHIMDFLTKKSDKIEHVRLFLFGGTFLGFGLLLQTFTYFLPTLRFLITQIQ